MHGTTSGLVYAADYSEEIRLADGTTCLLRPITGADKARLVDGFERLSPYSRYQRFHGHKSELSAEELEYLTEVDGYDHFALIALLRAPTGDYKDAIAGARLVRLVEQPQVAEISITVIDEYHGRGLGRELLNRIACAASERRIDRIQVYVLADNEPMRQLIRDVFDNVRFVRDGTVLVSEFPLHDTAKKPQRGAASALLLELLRLAAEQSIAPLRLALDVSAAGYAALRWGEH